MPLIIESDFSHSYVFYGKNGMLPEIPDTYLSLIDSGSMIGVSIDPLREEPSLQIRIKTEEDKKDYIVTFFQHLQNKHYHLNDEIRHYSVPSIERINTLLGRLPQEFPHPPRSTLGDHYRWYLFFHKIKDGAIKITGGTYSRMKNQTSDHLVQRIQNSLIQLLELES